MENIIKITLPVHPEPSIEWYKGYVWFVKQYYFRKEDVNSLTVEEFCIEVSDMAFEDTDINHKDWLNGYKQAAIDRLKKLGAE